MTPRYSGAVPSRSRTPGCSSAPARIGRAASAWAWAIPLVVLGALAFPAVAVGQEKGEEPKEPGLIRPLVGHKSGIYALALYINKDAGKYLAISAEDGGPVRLWNLAKGQSSEPWTPQGGTTHLAFHNQAKGEVIYWANTGGEIALVQLAGAKQSGKVAHKPSWIHGLVQTKDGSVLLSGCSEGVVHAWQVKTGEKLLTLDHQAAVACLALDAAEKRVVTGCKDGSIHLWEFKAGAAIDNLKTGDPVLAVAFSPDGNEIVSAGGNELRVWKVKGGDLVRKIAVTQGNETLECAAFSADSRWAVTGHSDGSVMVWDLEAKGAKALERWKRHEEGVRCIAISPDGRFAVSGGQDGIVRFWKLRQDK